MQTRSSADVPSEAASDGIASLLHYGEWYGGAVSRPGSGVVDRFAVSSYKPKSWRYRRKSDPNSTHMSTPGPDRI